MHKLKEAAEAAISLSHKGLMLDLIVRPEGILARATIGLLQAFWLVSWEQINQSHINPLLAALSVVAETVKGKTDG